MCRMVSGPFTCDRRELTAVEMTTYQPGLTTGVYAYRVAARLVGVPAPRITRWADGYIFQVKEGYGSSRPVLQTERHKGVITFNELFELFFVREYVALGVSLPHVRRTAEVLADQLGPHPFASAELIVSGRELILNSAESVLQRPDVGQLVADFAVGFARQVAFRSNRAAQYRPHGFQSHVFLDREIRAGEAVVTSHAIPTRSIYALWEQEKSIPAVAEYYDIPASDVSAAVRYEGQWRLAA